MLIFDRCHHSLAGVTPVKYEHAIEWRKFTGRGNWYSYPHLSSIITVSIIVVLYAIINWVYCDKIKLGYHSGDRSICFISQLHDCCVLSGIISVSLYISILCVWLKTRVWGDRGIQSVKYIDQIAPPPPPPKKQNKTKQNRKVVIY